MYHSLTVHIHQPPGNTFKLSGVISSVMSVVSVGARPYELEPVRPPMCLDELDNIPIDHPFRNHRKEPFPHRHSQQWEHIWMAKGLPCDNFPAERLRDHGDHQLFDAHFWQPLGGDSHL